jgi:hypothetical protein
MGAGQGFREQFATVTAAIRAAGSLATALVNGSMSPAQFKALRNVPAAWEFAPILTPKIDLTTLATTAGVIPAKAGFYFVHLSTRFVLTDLAGVFTGAPTVKAGNNASKDNVMGAQANSPSVALLNAAAPVPEQGAGVLPTQGTQLIDLATAVDVVVTVATTGGATGKIRYVWSGFYVPIADFA